MTVNQFNGVIAIDRMFLEYSMLNIELCGEFYMDAAVDASDGVVVVVIVVVIVLIRETGKKTSSIEMCKAA